MNARKTVEVIMWSAAILWCLLCVWLSWQTGEETAYVSGKLAKYIVRVLSHFGVVVNEARFHIWLRRSAHAAVFGVMGVLFASSFCASVTGERLRGMKIFLGSAFICSFIASAAETVKLWIPGRHLEMKELVLNLIGAAVGIIAVAVIDVVTRRILSLVEHWERGER